MKSKMKRLGIVAVLLLGAGSAAYAQDPRNPFTGDSWGDFLGGAKAVCADKDVDNDNDGLIELCYLEDLDAIRHQPNGMGLKTTDGAPVLRTGCDDGDPNTNDDECDGYELVRDLDFTDPDSYRYPEDNLDEYTVTSFMDEMDNGWKPIGTDNPAFTSLFEGNGHTLSNLMISRTNQSIGLFSRLETNAEIRNFGLLNVEIQGGAETGGLSGINSGTSINNYVTGRITVRGGNSVGGLFGASNSTALTTNTYVTASVRGAENVGGIDGRNNGEYINSYATGRISGSLFVGGIAGLDLKRITNSYATGRVTAPDDAGGLVGGVFRNVVMDSYWDIDSSGQANSAGGGLKV